MTAPDDFARVKAAFLAVRERPAAEQEAALCEALDDEALRTEVRALLGYDDDSEFIRPPDPDLAPEPLPDDGEPPPPLVGEVLDERFIVEAPVAEGGFGWIFRGRDTARDEPVAIKLFKPIEDPDLRADVEAAFDREGRALEALAPRSPHIVEYRDIGTWTDPDGARRAFIVMEWLDGVTLAEHVTAEHGAEPLPLDAACALLTPVADALTIAHRHGVAHRDVKPSNVLVVPGPAGPTLKLVDFGAAKLAAERARGFQSTGGRVGMVTFDYSAPEQLNKAYGATGPWSDVFALALLAVELMAGRHPWRHLDLLTAMDRAVDRRTRPTPRTMGVDVTDAVEAVFARALAVDPTARYPDAGAFWNTLTAARRGEAPAPAPPPPEGRGISVMGYVIAAGAIAIIAAMAWWLIA